MGSKRIIKFSLYPLYKLYKYIYYKYGKKHPMWLANRLYKKNFGRFVNWDNPTEMNEKIRWMQFFSDTSLWTELADKYKARKFIEEKGYGNILVPLLGVWDDANKIDFSLLPKSFVIKTNHGCGDVYVIKDKSQVDLELLRSKMQTYLHTPFGYENIELHYLRIKPCILAEEMLPLDINYSSSIVDYKFYCLNGKPYCCGVFYDRDVMTHHTNSTFYDMNWIRHDEWRNLSVKRPSKDIPRPYTLNKMIQACNDLASTIPFVRIDFYEVNNNLYFGEFTFTPASLSGGSLSKRLCEEIGEKIILPSRK